jgi:hypothetical protein
MFNMIQEDGAGARFKRGVKSAWESQKEKVPVSLVPSASLCQYLGQVSVINA